jgi:ABC-type sugar transport system ATPase subunit
MKATENVLEIRDLVKDSPGVRAVNNVRFTMKRSTIHCMVGENGTGKSTISADR